MNKSLIKNLDKKWRDAFFAEGNIRLQPLSYFRTSPDAEKQDEDEGTRGVRAHARETIRHEFQKFALGNVAIRSSGPHKTFFQAEPGSKVDVREVLPEVYVFCVSEVRCEVHGDAAYSIQDIEGFRLAVADALDAIGKPVCASLVASVSYGRLRDTLGSQHEFDAAMSLLQRGATYRDYFCKPSSFANEKEWRFVFILEKDAHVTGCQTIRDKRLVNFCGPYCPS